MRRLKIVIFGLSVTSSWGNGHATPYRCLMRGLTLRDHDVLFLERDVPSFAAHRDLPHRPYGRTRLYATLREAKELYRREVREADVVIVGSSLPEGTEVGRWVTATARGLTAFYDIDTPVTLAKLERREEDYISRDLVARYDMYLSSTGGPILDRIERKYGTSMVRTLYCSVDPSVYYPEPAEIRWDLGYMGTYSEDRQPTLTKLLVESARRWKNGRMVVAGPLYPANYAWAENIDRVEHLPPPEHRHFYNSQRFTLNVTRSDMVREGYAPSVRLFEAAACGTPIISDYWVGLDTFFELGSDILIANSARDILRYLKTVSETERLAIGSRARAKVLGAHTAAHRAAELEGYVKEALGEPEAPTHVPVARKREYESNSRREKGVIHVHNGTNA